MALHWSWAFGNEDLTDLTAMGWTTAASQYLALTTDADKVYTYDGSPTRYGWIFDGNYGTFTLPIPAVSGLTNGWIAAPWKSTVGSGYYTIAQVLLRIVGTSGERIQCNVTSGGGIALYVSNTLKETSAVVDWTEWRYVALRWDLSANPWSGQVYVDGVAVTALQTQSDAAETAGSAQIGPGPGVFNSPTSFCSQVIVWDSTADAGETAYYVTRAEPTADGTNVGTWTPSTGSDDFAVVDSPFDAATYTQEASPAASDRCEVVTSSIATATGITPGTIAGVTAHTYSEGQAITAKAVVSISGGTEADGDTTTISASSTSYAYATDTASYSATDTIDVIYEVVST
jgi:hypothetical protein